MTILYKRYLCYLLYTSTKVQRGTLLEMSLYSTVLSPLNAELLALVL